MKVLMFGWEFPPYNSGGLGTACYGLTKSLAEKNVDISFVLPNLPREIKHKFLKFLSPNIRLYEIDTILKSYITSKEYQWKNNIYGPNLYKEVERYAEECLKIIDSNDFDIIHSHDWITIQAGIKVKEISKKPLIFHMHNTAFDRTGGNPDMYELMIEKEGLKQADRIIAVSNYTKNILMSKYGIKCGKINVIHNGCTQKRYTDRPEKYFKNTVLFAGRITLQKGPDYFIKTAEKVLEFMPDTIFIVTGSGDMEKQIIEDTIRLGLSDNFIFTGFLRGKNLENIFKIADVYVMPSVSEPFGLTPLEVMQNKTPVIISKQSGVSEILRHCLKSDFWDIDKMANQIISILTHKELRNELEKNGLDEALKITWDKPAEKLLSVYRELVKK